MATYASASSKYASTATAGITGAANKAAASKTSVAKVAATAPTKSPIPTNKNQDIPVVSSTAVATAIAKSNPSQIVAPGAPAAGTRALFPTAPGGALAGQNVSAAGNAANAATLAAYRASGGTTTSTYVDQYTNLANPGESAIQEAVRLQTQGTIDIFNKVAAAAGKPAMAVTAITGGSTKSNPDQAATANAALLKQNLDRATIAAAKKVAPSVVTPASIPQTGTGYINPILGSQINTVAGSATPTEQGSYFDSLIRNAVVFAQTIGIGATIDDLVAKNRYVQSLPDRSAQGEKNLSVVETTADKITLAYAAWQAQNPAPNPAKSLLTSQPTYQATPAAGTAPAAGKSVFGTVANTLSGFISRISAGRQWRLSNRQGQ